MVTSECRDPLRVDTASGPARTPVPLGEPRVVFVNSMSDLFHPSLPTTFIQQVFSVMAENVALSLSKGMRVVVTGRLDQRSWETDEGEHRSKVEITADEIGPSLLFATADVQRTERRQEVSESESEVSS
jgi:hypothetical protein